MSEDTLLVGMLDSPFVRRVAITLLEYQLPFKNLALRTVGDAEAFAEYSPLKRAPTLILPGGEPLFDSHLILEHLDEQVSKPEQLLPMGPSRRLLCRQVVGIAAGLADKAVSAIYEKSFHAEKERSAALLARILGQLSDAVTWLDERAPEGEFLFGSRFSHADVMVGTALCFTREVHADLLDLETAPRLRAWCERLDALPAFQQTYLKVEPPNG